MSWHRESARHSLAARGFRRTHGGYTISSDRNMYINPKFKDGPLREVIETVIEHPEIREVYLFGSQVRGVQTEKSDYDILIVMEHHPGQDRTYEDVVDSITWSRVGDGGIGSRSLFDPKIITVEQYKYMERRERSGINGNLGNKYEDGWSIPLSELKDRVLIYRRRT